MNNFFKFLRRVYIWFLYKIEMHPDMDVRIRKLKELGFSIGNNVFIDNVEIEDLYPEFLKIEDDVVIAYGTRILVHDSSMNNLFGDPIRFGKVIIKKGAYIGSKCIIMPGVTIGEGALIGAGSLVTHNVKDHMVAFGSPAKEYMKVIEYREKFLKSIDKDEYYYWDILPFSKRILEENWLEKEKESYRNFIKTKVTKK
ncbi:MAG: acyltransferase [Patescibacteria group bacterium]